MSYSNALQTAIYARLTTYAPLVALVGARVYDAPPKGAAYPYVSFGPSDSVTEDMECIAAETQTLQIDIWSSAQDGQRECKAIRDQVKAALHLWQAEPTVGALVLARVTLSRILPDPDNSLTHGVVQVECDVEAP